MRCNSRDSPASCEAVCSVCAELVSDSCVACATSVTATRTCSAAVACCLVESSISRAASAAVITMPAICLNDAATSVNWRAPVSTALAPVSVAITVVLTAPRTSSTCVRIFLVEFDTRSASLRISSATTAKRLPASPAPEASMVALIARILVCSANSDTMSSTAPISCDLRPRSSMCDTTMSIWRRMPDIASCPRSTVPVPTREEVAVWSAICATRCALSAIWRDVTPSSLMVVLISLMADACCLVPAACCVAAACNSADELCTRPTAAPNCVVSEREVYVAAPAKSSRQMTVHPTIAALVLPTVVSTSPARRSSCTCAC